VTARLVDLADGLTSILDERLAPEGADLAHHFLLVARKLQEAEHGVALLCREPGPFDTDDRGVLHSDASYALLEAARAVMGLAVRLRARFTGQHARRASEPLRAGLRALAADPEPGDDARLELLRASHALVQSAHAAEVADRAADARTIGTMLDEPIQHLVAGGVLPLLRLAVRVQEGDLS